MIPVETKCCKENTWKPGTTLSDRNVVLNTYQVLPAQHNRVHFQGPQISSPYLTTTTCLPFHSFNQVHGCRLRQLFWSPFELACDRAPFFPADISFFVFDKSLGDEEVRTAKCSPWNLGEKMGMPLHNLRVSKISAVHSNLPFVPTYVYYLPTSVATSGLQRNFI
jgi:hypothetical protein